MPTTRVVLSSAARLAGSVDNYEARLPFDIMGVVSVSLVGATVPFPPANAVSGEYVVLRIDGMETVFSNDDVINRCFLALPTVDRLEKILPVTYCPPKPMLRLSRMRVSFVDRSGAPVSFTQDHILQFDIVHERGSAVEPAPTPISDANATVSPADSFAGLGSELDDLINAGARAFDPTDVVPYV